MQIAKIDDGALKSENRYHINQPDVPDMSAEQMKEFMDYVPRKVIIPKVNEVIDALSEKADTDASYTKEQADNLLKDKADRESVYTKEQADNLLKDKADRESVYTKEQTDAKVSVKEDKGICANALKGAVSGSELVEISDVSPAEHTLKLRLSCVTKGIYEGALVSEVGAPLACAFDNESSLISQLDGFTYETESNWNDDGTSSSINVKRLFEVRVDDPDLTDDTDDGESRYVCILKEDAGYSLMIKDGFSVRNTFTLADWISGEADINAVLPDGMYIEQIYEDCDKVIPIITVEDISNTKVTVCATNNLLSDGEVKVGKNNWRYVSYTLPAGYYKVFCDEPTTFISVTNGYIVNYIWNEDKTKQIAAIVSHKGGYGETYFHYGEDYAKAKVHIARGTGGITPYEEYKGGTYSVNADGTVDGALSVSPDMTIFTDTANVTIDCEYNRDINKAFAELMTKLTGGE